MAVYYRVECQKDWYVLHSEAEALKAAKELLAKPCDEVTITEITEIVGKDGNVLKLTKPIRLH